ncbi:MAG TPA: penicillin-binding protein activator [Gammaproteobacteria bacterium]|nr:penicillin-binding protein activator [Gammaproteobacteria bacterium]
MKLVSLRRRHASRLATGCILDFMAVIAAIIVLTACAPQPNVRTGTTAATTPASTDAWALRERGDHAAAAAAFLQLAARSHPATEAENYRLQAVQSYLDAGDIKSAQALLNQIQLRPEEANWPWRQILSARLLRAQGQSEAALNALATLPVERLQDDIHDQVLALRAELLETLGRQEEAAIVRLQREPLLQNDPRQQENRETLWKDLNAMPPARIAQSLAAAPANLRPWLELVQLTQTTAGSPAAYAAQAQRWRIAHPDHPAAAFIALPAAGALAAVAPPKVVALLLPLEGPFAEAGDAIRDGFMAAWYEDAGSAKPAVAVYNASTGNIAQAYDAAVGAGAGFIIGPLEKGAVEALISRGSLPVPTLALNQINEPVSEGAPAAANVTNLYQFGLSPETEARQAAERAWLDGHVRALALVSSDNWGQRLLQAFKSQWESLGGALVDYQTYAPDSRDYATSVKKVLQIDRSEARIDELKKILGRKIMSEPRRRQDADLIFLAASAAAARQLCPQLQFFRAADLPVYATSHVYTGALNAVQDRDLNGVQFGDMPWVLQEGGAFPLKATLHSAWPEITPAQDRLYALGVDAYRLLMQLPQLAQQPAARLEGATGTLSLNTDGVIQRQLTWARFSNGLPALMDGAVTAPSTAAAPAP